MAKKVTSLRAFSRLANVSIATASRFYSNPEVLSPKTRKRLTDLAKSLDYRPSAVARAAFGGKTKSIGVLVPTLGLSFFSDIAQSIQRKMLSEGFLPIILQSSDSEFQSLNRLIDHRVDAMILHLTNESPNRKDVVRIFDLQIPTVLIGASQANLHLDNVSTDDINGGYLAGEHLAELGHRRFSFLGAGDGYSDADVRLEGFKKALLKYERTLRKQDIIYASHGHTTNIADFEEKIAQMLKQPNRPTAIFAYTDLLACSVYRVARSLGLKIPDDLSIVGYANLNFSEFVDPPLTTINQNGLAVGEIATELIFQKLKDPNMPISRQLVTTELIVRASTQPLSRTLRKKQVN